MSRPSGVSHPKWLTPIKAALSQLKYYSVDKMHAQTHVDTCPNNPLKVLRLKRRLKEINTQICEQTFSWFRGYARVFNSLRSLRHRFVVLYFAKKHNEMVDKNDMSHLNEFSSGSPYRKKPTSYPCMKKIKKCMRALKPKKQKMSMKTMKCK